MIRYTYVYRHALAGRADARVAQYKLADFMRFHILHSLNHSALSFLRDRVRMRAAVRLISKQGEANEKKTKRANRQATESAPNASNGCNIHPKCEQCSIEVELSTWSMLPRMKMSTRPNDFITSRRPKSRVLYFLVSNYAIFRIKK